MSFTGPSKCKVCDKTAYQLEAIVYDSMVYHKHCFKCLQCGSSVSLKKVAMIQGDLYCKNCFLRMFAEKGNYKVFSENNKTERPSHSTAQSVDLTNISAAATAAVEAQATANYLMTKARRGSILSCLMEECTKPRAAGVNYCLEHQRAETEQEAADLIKAIDAKSVKDMKDVVQQKGVKLLLKENSKRQTPLEYAFASGSNALAVVMIQMLADRINNLEEQVRTLQEQLEDSGNGRVKLNRPRRNSAPRSQLEEELQGLELKSAEDASNNESATNNGDASASSAAAASGDAAAAAAGGDAAAPPAEAPAADAPSA